MRRPRPDLGCGTTEREGEKGNVNRCENMLVIYGLFKVFLLMLAYIDLYTFYIASRGPVTVYD